MLKGPHTSGSGEQYQITYYQQPINPLVLFIEISLLNELVSRLVARFFCNFLVGLVVPSFFRPIDWLALFLGIELTSRVETG